MAKIARALTIAGSDSGGGAGIQADLKTFSALGVYGASAITAVTSQDTQRVYGVVEMEPAFVASQIDAVIADIGVDAVKTGMLSSAAIIEAVVDRLRAWEVTTLVVDPVMVAKGGDKLLRDDAVS
ncbi:MAG TPA: bifunctional hydroxymethylpyrimidine kinase/phosphomethylpyrimidine kinase, partial [Dehalococcoidia bacterium]|nr:bifunctional hydroxymethylpyrimidine kinase/phosphomethylpyrimidine kinase [Dehalococcoidia bacterium]